MPTRRLFVSLPVPASVRAEFAKLVTRLPDVRWLPDEQWHVTMRFLGNVDDARVDEICDRLAAIRVEPFLLPTEGVGAFPAKGHPHVLWVGTGNGHPRLHQLRQRLDDALLAAGIDFDLRTFHPHITLARCGEDARVPVAQWLRHHAKFEGPPFPVDAFELMESELRPAGAHYSLVKRFELSKPA
ncbi:MAG TPA: RNA 2',3'-cyclic phosphodiesterase [Opitutus sp.]|nr:RNA 2',3'-cyclic phosphodiesterase [Opitutus sp.]